MNKEKFKESLGKSKYYYLAIYIFLACPKHKQRLEVSVSLKAQYTYVLLFKNHLSYMLNVIPKVKLTLFDI